MKNNKEKSLIDKKECPNHSFYIIDINSLPPEKREKYKEICEWLEKQRKEYP